jgi:arsenate reductase (glutaredoxin)
MQGIVVYQKPTCTTCRQVFVILREAGIDATAVNYFVDPLPAAKIRELLKKMKLAPRELLRVKDPLYKELNLAQTTLTDDDIIELMVRHPGLLQRPIVERGSRAILARPAERIREIL